MQRLGLAAVAPAARMQRLMLPILVLMLTAALASPASASSYKRVRPTVLPGTPAPTERIVVRFRARETLDGTYSAEVEPWPENGCAGSESPRVRAPRRGRVIRLKLAPSRIDERRWCSVRYRATVFFKQTVHCPPTVNCGDSAYIAIGSTTFTVTPEPAPPGESPG